MLVIDIANSKNRESNEVKPGVWAMKNTITRVPIDSGIPTIIEILPTNITIGNRKSGPNDKK